MTSLCRDCAHPWPDQIRPCPNCGSERLVSHPELLDLCIAHIDCDAFYASVEKRDNPDLIDKPVIVGHAGGRGVVTTACYVARKFGPRSAMPMFKALELCPHAVVIPPNIAKYRQVSAQIRELFLMATPMVEPVSLDEAYLDLSPQARLVDRPAAILLARLARAIEQRVGVTVSVGLSYNKSLAKLASDLNKPRGFSIIGEAEARDFLATLPVTAIHGVGAATAHKLEGEGITRVHQLQEQSETALIARFGKFGRALFRLVQGQDSRPVTPDRPTKSVSTETTFRTDIRDAGELAQALRMLCDKLALRLERSQLAGSNVVLKLKTHDFKILTRNRQLPYATHKAEVIFDHACRLLSKEADGRAFRLIGVGVADLTDGAKADPPDLFADLT